MSAVLRKTRHLAELIGSPRTKASRLASTQHGVVATWQLLILGYSHDLISADVASNRLHRLHRGVFAVGHTHLTLRGRWMAAVLVCGPNAVLSHRAAAALHALRPAPTGDIDVTVPGGHTSRSGIHVHSVRHLHRDDCTMIDGIPVTTLERTLLDYSHVAGQQWTRLAIEAAQRQDGLDATRYQAMLARNRGRRTRTLRAMMSQVADEPPWTLSEVERRLLAGLRGAGVTEPQVNALVEGELVDLYWPPERLVVEVDGDFWHRTPAARENDRRRDVKLQLSGRRVVRFGDRRVMHELPRVVSEITALLARPRAEASGEGRG